MIISAVIFMLVAQFQWCGVTANSTLQVHVPPSAAVLGACYGVVLPPLISTVTGRVYVRGKTKTPVKTPSQSSEESSPSLTLFQPPECSHTLQYCSGI